MNVMASQITGVSIVYSNVLSGANKKNLMNVCSASLAFVTGEFTVQRASNAENVSIWWLHHVGRWLDAWLEPWLESTRYMLHADFEILYHWINANKIPTTLYFVKPWLTSWLWCWYGLPKLLYKNDINAIWFLQNVFYIKEWLDWTNEIKLVGIVIKIINIQLGNGS